MIDLARLHPMRVARGVLRRLMALTDPNLRTPPLPAPAPPPPAPETKADTIVRMTLEKLAGRVQLPKFSVTFSDRQVYRADATYHRERDGYVLELATVDEQFNSVNRTRELGSAYLYWLMQCPPQVRSLSVTLSDGDEPSAARFAGSANRTDVVLIPDPYFFRYAGFQSFRDLVDRAPVEWSERSSEIVWRGTSSGHGTFDPVMGARWPSLAAQRLELILAAKRVPGVDAALADYRRRDLRPVVLEQAGIIRAPVAEESWAHRKFAIDVDGWTNTWSNLFIRMMLGCCVLKLDSKYGYRQWYYDRLRPWEHYVPVKADASDLGEKVEWVRANDAEAARIAANGQRFAQALTFEVGQREAVELITQHWQG